MEQILLSTICNAMAASKAALIRTVAADFGLNEDEMLARYGLAEAQEKPAKRAQEKSPCTATNAKKQPCKRPALPGGCLCKLHQRLSSQPKEDKPVCKPVTKIPPPEQSESLKPEEDELESMLNEALSA